MHQIFSVYQNSSSLHTFCNLQWLFKCKAVESEALIRLRLLEISIIQLRLRTDSDLQLY